MELREFHRYLNDKVDELAGCQKQTEEVHERIQAIFKREMAAWQEVFGYCYHSILSERATLPPRFAARLNQVEAEEQTRVRGEITALKVQVREGRKQMDELMAQASAETGRLQAVNPKLNKQEENYKRRVVQFQDEYAQAFETADQLESQPFGWLLHMGRLRRLRKAQRVARQEQNKVLGKLREVRQNWLKQVEEVGDTQSTLRERWQQVSIETSQAQTRQEHMEDNFEVLAEQAAARRTLEELTEAYDVTGELGDKLAELARRNQVRLAYEKGLAASAEALGLQRGIGTGLAKFRDSVGSVVQTQRRHSLPKATVVVPQSVALINQTWKQFHAKVENEQSMADHPLEFADLVKRYLSDRLYDETIKAFFEQMGAALNQATKKWR
jgi:hypothetical protein